MFRRSVWRRPDVSHNKDPCEEVHLSAVIITFSVEHDQEDEFNLPRKVVDKLDYFTYCLFDKPSKRAKLTA